MAVNTFGFRPTDTIAAYAKPHHVWETALWMAVAERQLVRRTDGRYHLLTGSDALPGNQVLANQLKPCVLQVREDGRFVFAFTAKSSTIYSNGHSNNVVLLGEHGNLD